MWILARRNRIFVAIAIFTMILMAACWQPIAAWFSPAPAWPREKLTIAPTGTYPGSGLLYVAAAKGYFAQEGLDVTLQPYTSGRDALDAALDQSADLAAVGDIPIMFSTMDGIPVSIIATIFTAVRTHGIVARRDHSIARIADLKHKIIGVALRTDSHFVLSTMLARHRVALSEVRIESLAPEEMLAALKSGKVDAISIWEPLLSAARTTLAENGVIFRAEGRFVFNFNLAGRQDWIRANPDKVQRLLRVMLRVKRFIDEKPQEALAIMAAAMKIDPNFFNSVEANGPNYHFVVELDQNLLAMLDDQARWAIQNKLTDRMTLPNFLDVIDMAPLTTVQPDAVTIIR